MPNTQIVGYTVFRENVIRVLRDKIASFFIMNNWKDLNYNLLILSNMNELANLPLITIFD